MSVEEELAFLEQTADLQMTFLAAKTTRDTDPAGYAAAKTAWSQHRTYWRQIREWFQAGGTAPEGN